MTTLKRLRGRLEPWKGLLQDLEDLGVLYEMALAEQDQSQEAEIKELLVKVEEQYKRRKVLELLSDEADPFDAYVDIHAGAGGTEACDWASMLLRCTRAGPSAASSRSKWWTCSKPKAASNPQLSRFRGIRLRLPQGRERRARLVRISPFDAAARRHTSFTSVAVHPVIDDTITATSRTTTLRVDTYRAQGAGGQHVNKTDSAVR